jgi:hypothetical protein
MNVHERHERCKGDQARKIEFALYLGITKQICFVVPWGRINVHDVHETASKRDLARLAGDLQFAFF